MTQRVLNNTIWPLHHTAQ